MRTIDPMIRMMELVVVLVKFLVKMVELKRRMMELVFRVMGLRVGMIRLVMGTVEPMMTAMGLMTRVVQLMVGMMELMMRKSRWQLFHNNPARFFQKRKQVQSKSLPELTQHGRGKNPEVPHGAEGLLP